MRKHLNASVSALSSSIVLDSYHLHVFVVFAGKISTRLKSAPETAAWHSEIRLTQPTAQGAGGESATVSHRCHYYRYACDCVQITRRRFLSVENIAFTINHESNFHIPRCLQRLHQNPGTPLRESRSATEKIFRKDSSTATQQHRTSKCL